MRTAARFALRQVRARPLACFALAFLAGLLVQEKAALSTLACGLSLTAVTGLCIALRRKRYAVLALILLSGFLAGMTRMGIAVESFQPVETQYSVEMVGRVISEPFTNVDSGRRICRFRVETVDDTPSSLRLRLYLRGEDTSAMEAVAYGQRLRLTGHIWAADPTTNPYEFDFGAYLHRQGLDAYATAKIEDVQTLSTGHDLRSALIQARQAVARRIDLLFPDSAGLMRALVLGDRSMLGDELREAMNRTGTAHLISISGLHVTVLCFLLASLLRRFTSRRISNLVALALLIPYGMMIGFTAAFVRALLMFAILCWAPIAGYPSDPVTRLCTAMLFWLMLHPLSVGDAGFALSFSASAGILLLMPPMLKLTGIASARHKKPSMNPWKRLIRDALLYIPTLLCVSLSAQLATLPYVVAFFGVQSLVALPFNLICVPLCILGFILGLIVLVLSLISVPAALLVSGVPNALFKWLIAITGYGMNVPSASVRIGRYSILLILLHWAVVLAASDLCRFPFRWRRFLPLGIVGVAAISSLLILRIAWPFGIVFLDAGQGDCAIVRSRGHTFMIDAGDTYTPAADFLNATCLHLDGVVLTHPHQDHAGGLSGILTNFCPDAIYVPKGWFDVEEVSPDIIEGIERARELGAEIRELHTGDSVRISSEATIDVYSPDGRELPSEVNDLSLLTLVTCEGQRALFTGDLSKEGEPDVIPDADILKVAHHGSIKATSDRFLAAVTPDIAVISVGENNYGHPAPETLDKLADSGAFVYQTIDSGCITLTWVGGAWRIKTYREAVHELE